MKLFLKTVGIFFLGLAVCIAFAAMLTFVSEPIAVACVTFAVPVSLSVAWGYWKDSKGKTITPAAVEDSPEP